MVTRNQLDALQGTPPSILQAYDPDTLFSEALEDIRAYIPEWDGSEDSILYKAVRRMTFRHYLVLERVNNSIRRSFLYYATGSDLDAVVRARGLTRQTGETDAQLKERALRATQIPAIGTVKGIESLIYNWPDEEEIEETNGLTIQDVQVKIRSDRHTIDVWPALRGTLQPDRLSGEQTTALQTYLNNDARKYIGTGIVVNQAGIYQATIEATITYDPDYDLTTLQNFVHERWLSECRWRLANIGHKVSQSRIISCLYLPGVQEITLTRMSIPPANSGVSDLPATDGRLYTMVLTDGEAIPNLTWVKGT